MLCRRLLCFGLASISILFSACNSTGGSSGGLSCTDQSLTISETRPEEEAPAAFLYFALTPGPSMDPLCTQVGGIWIIDFTVQADVEFENPLCGGGIENNRIHINSIRISNGLYHNEFEFRPNYFNSGILPHCTAGRLFIDGLAPNIQFEMNGDIHLERNGRWNYEIDGSSFSTSFYSIYESNIQLENLEITGLDPTTEFIRDFIINEILDSIDREVAIAVNRALCACDSAPPVGEEDFPLYVDDYDPR